jgi:hypothetical protein
VREEVVRMVQAVATFVAFVVTFAFAVTVGFATGGAAFFAVAVGVATAEVTTAFTHEEAVA